MADAWDLPVSFYFLVTFQNMEGMMVNVPFREVSGLGWKLQTKDQEVETGVKIKVMESLTYGDLVLKRPITPLDEDFSKWVDDCIRKLSALKKSGGKVRIKTCSVVVKLLDSKGAPRAAWSCTCAYPSAYSLSDLNAESSNFAIESITLSYSSIERKK